MKRISDKRMAHMHGVAEYMATHAIRYGLKSTDMYVLGLVHDVGYMYGKEDHEVLGARILNAVGFSFSDIVSWHGTSPEDYLKLTDLDKVPKELVLLWDADMHVNAQGEEVSYLERLQDIANRYGDDSIEYRLSSERVDWLREHVCEYVDEF